VHHIFIENPKINQVRILATAITSQKQVKINDKSNRILYFIR